MQHKLYIAEQFPMTKIVHYSVTNMSMTPTVPRDKQRIFMGFTEARLSYLEADLHSVFDSLLQHEWGLLEVLQVSWTGTRHVNKSQVTEDFQAL